ncbi:hypothetical protein Glove_123g45 [Diversispora epigaea]|uniref:AAA+ ATPase domain-containing protein n=1 Tax=Diversispora epigaea TaxID=1348612 RepID=A0A397J2D1_9GLOM|nr:hypothetical protein Glove_123g45 [Diversispora epigaea]
MLVPSSLRCLPAWANRVSRIPLTRGNSYLSRNNTFFNRKRELTEFTEALSSPRPRIHVLLGPPNSGKTTLVQQVVDKLPFKPLFFDCRGGIFSTPTNMYYAIINQFYPYFKQLSVSSPSLKVDTRNIFKRKSEINAQDVIGLLRRISDPLLKWAQIEKEPAPILIIDEANMLKLLGDSSELALTSLLTWLVKNSIQDQRFHVVLTTSDPLFLNWIQNILNISHLTPYVVGDLSKEDAEEYFDTYLLPQFDSEISSELKGKFDEVSKVTGTRMYVIEKFVEEYKYHKGEIEKFSMFEQEFNRLKFGLEYEKPKKIHKFEEKPLWDGDDLRDTLKEIVEKNNEFIYTNDLVLQIGEVKVNSLLEHNFLHLRPTQRFTYDIDNLDVSKVGSILTPTNRPLAYAMEYILNGRF